MGLYIMDISLNMNARCCKLINNSVGYLRNHCLVLKVCQGINNSGKHGIICISPLCLNYPMFPTIVDIPLILSKLDSDSIYFHFIVK